MGLNYLFHYYMQVCDKWILADNSNPPFQIVAEGTRKGLAIRDMERYNRIRALVTNVEDLPVRSVEEIVQEITQEMARVPQAHDGVPFQGNIISEEKE